VTPDEFWNVLVAVLLVVMGVLHVRFPRRVALWWARKHSFKKPQDIDEDSLNWFYPIFVVTVGIGYLALAAFLFTSFVVFHSW